MAEKQVTKTVPQSGTKDGKTMAEGGKVLKLGSKHGRPATPVTSTVRTDAKIDQQKAEAAGFFGTAEAPKYRVERWIPYIATGKDLSVDAAIENFREFVRSLDACMKADKLVVEDKDGKVLWEGESKVAAPNGITAGAYACQLVAESIILANQQEMNPPLRAQVLEDAKAQGLLKVGSEKAAATRRQRIVA